MAEVVQLSPSPPLSDIPGQLRQMADLIERGEIQADAALFIIPQGHDWPTVFGWGDSLGVYGNIAVCEMAKTWLVNNSVERNG